MKMYLTLTMICWAYTAMPVIHSAFSSPTCLWMSLRMRRRRLLRCSEVTIVTWLPDGVGSALSGPWLHHVGR